MTAVATDIPIHEHVSCELMLTSACNLACEYCIARELRPHSMEADLTRKAVDLLIFLAQGASSIEFTFTGGEPLLRFPVLKSAANHINRSADAANMRSSLVLKTNGTIMSGEIARFLKHHRALVVVSIDGTSDVHDKHRRSARGAGTHNLVSRNIQVMLEHQIDCIASLTVHPDSCESVLASIRFLQGIGLKAIDVAPAYGTVTWKRRQSDALARLLGQIAAHMRQENSREARLEVGPLYQKTEHVADQLMNCWGCRAASSNLAIMPDGRITGCSALAMLVPRFPSLVIGSVLEGVDEEAVRKLRELAQAGPKQRLACKSCPAKRNCTGGCLAINYATKHHPLIPPSFYCRTISAIPQAWSVAWT